MFKFDAVISRIWGRHGELLVKQAKAQMEEISHGKQHDNLPNVSSKWGDSPNNQFGHYSKSIRHIVRGEKLIFGAGNAKVAYVRWLETEGNRPNIDKAAVVCASALDNVVAEEFRGADFMPKMSGFTRS